MSLRLKVGIIKVCAVIALLIFVYITRSTWIQALLILALSSAFSLLLAPVCQRLENVGMKRSMAAIVSIAALLLMLVLFLLIFIPYIFSHTVELLKRMTPTVMSVFDRIHVMLQGWNVDYTLQTDFPQLIASALTPLTAGLARGSVAVLSAIGHIVFSLFIAYYLLTIRYTINRHLLLIIPLRYRNAFLSALSGCKNAVLSYLSGMIKTCAFVGAATFAGLILLGMKDAAILALFMGILEVLPYIGPVLGAVPIMISAVPMGWGKTILALILIFLVQQLESGVIGPYFTASSTSIHPLTAIVGVFIGGSLFGVAGILITVPILIVSRSVFWSVRSAAIRFDS